MKTGTVPSLLRGPSAAGVAAVLLTLLIPAIPAAAGGPADACAVADIDGIGWDGLQRLQSEPGLAWWIEFGAEMVVCGDRSTVESIGDRMATRAVAAPLTPAELWLSKGWEPAELAPYGIEVVAGRGRFAIVRAGAEQVAAAQRHVESEAAASRRRLAPLEGNTVVVRQAANDPPRETGESPETLQFLVDQVDGDRWFSDIEALATYNRYTHGPEILDARDWLVQQFQSLPGLVVTTPSFMVNSTVAYNVLATLTGTTRPDDWYIIGAHYDSTSQDPWISAPGAEDNASGCAGVLETARIFTAYPPEATVLFMCYSGEEQGLHGSYAHVSDLYGSGDHDKVQAMLDMDMIGYTSDSDLDCLLETDAWADWMALDFAAMAAQYTTLRIEYLWFAWGSDHVPYLDSGIPALLTIENDFQEYPYYHTTNDLPQHITIEMGEEIIKMNVAAMADMIGAASNMVFVDGFESGDVSAWSTAVP